MIIVKVVLPLPIRQYFKYFMPDYMFPVVGGRILVPFHSKDIIGIVVSFYNQIDISQLNFKYVKSLIDTESVYTNIVLDILIWISKNYHCPIGYLFFSVLPKILRTNYNIKNKYIYQWRITKKGQEFDSNQLKKRKKQLNTLLFLKKSNILSTDLKKHNLSKIILKRLSIQGLCKICFDYEVCIKTKYFNHNKEGFLLSKKLLIIINNIIEKKCFSSWLLTNINLYTKVKFYLGLIKLVLYEGMQVLILVPYIKDINTILFFLKKYFHVSIDIIHSELTNTEYLNNWIKIKNGQSLIVIGTGKSIFLPFLKLGLIIIFEEHHLNYKNMNQCKYNIRDKCRYNVRDIGILRAYKENIPIILDSDTPSLKTLHNILHKKCFYVKLYQCKRITRSNTIIVNLKKDKIKFGLSLTLINEIYKNFSTKQVLLIFNKFSLIFFALICKNCNYIFKCTSCHDYFEVNEYKNILLCKFCLVKMQKPIFCCNCGYISLIISNIGIEKIKNQIQNIFPKKSVFFLLNKKKTDQNLFKKNFFEFFSSIPYIIVTTEEIVQNYYFPHVRLISLICIDNYFRSFQFRAIEYFAQFYVNLHKLTKNRNKSLKILIQTSFTHDLNLKELYNNGYYSFANKILAIRKNFLLPPWSFQLIIYSESIYSENNVIFLHLIRTILKKKSHKYNCFLWFVGPHVTYLSKNEKSVFHQLLVQCSSQISLNHLFNECIDLVNIFSISRRVKWFVDIEPN